MKKIKITLVKSPIDRSERQKLTLKALGLNMLSGHTASGTACHCMHLTTRVLTRAMLHQHAIPSPRAGNDLAGLQFLRFV